METDRLINRVRSEFVEVPGLRLTLPQAMRLWGLDQEECQRVINSLIDSSFLSRNDRGQIVRAD